MKINDDEILLTALRNGKEKAFDIIFHKYFNAVFNFIFHNCHSKTEAQDLTQEVFIRLWQRRDSIQTASLKSYIFTIAKNILIDWTRQSINKQIFESLADELHVVPDPGPEPGKESTEDIFKQIQETADSMPKRRLEVYKLRWIDGFSRKEIANKMGITVTTVDIHLQKALEYLRNQLKVEN